jgi:flotillin
MAARRAERAAVPPILPDLLTPLLIAGAVVVLLLIALFVLLRGIKVAKPDEAIIVTS